MSKLPKYDEDKIYGEGARRLVYDLSSGSVLKVPKSDYGVISNKREVKIYKAVPFKLKKYLGRIKGFGRGYSWIKMKKYTRHFPNSKKYASKLRRLRRLFKKGGIHPYEVVSRLGEPNYQNLRLNEQGRIKVIDYGNFTFFRVRKRRKSRRRRYSDS